MILSFRGSALIVVKDSMLRMISYYGLSPHLFRAILQDGHSEVLIDEHGRVLSKVK